MSLVIIQSELPSGFSSDLLTHQMSFLQCREKVLVNNIRSVAAPDKLLLKVLWLSTHQQLDVAIMKMEETLQYANQRHLTSRDPHVLYNLTTQVRKDTSVCYSFTIHQKQSVSTQHGFGWRTEESGIFSLFLRL